MIVPATLAVGASSHTGRIRGNNEDDYLLGSLSAPGPFLCGVADGMGGLAGGAEASRTALRALAMAVLDGASKAPLAQRLRDGFAAASARVYEESKAVPALRDMGTTLTVLCVADGGALIGHVGDSRVYRVRAGKCEQLTTDHAVREPENLLTRCIGAGQATCAVDLAELELRPADRFVLVTDGVWGVLDPAAFQRLVERGDAQPVAESLVAQALAEGGPDNATAVVVDVLATPAVPEASRSVELPREERPGPRDLWPRAVSLRAPVWPWVVLAAAVALLLLASLQWLGVDGWGWLRARLGR